MTDMEKSLREEVAELTKQLAQEKHEKIFYQHKAAELEMYCNFYSGQVDELLMVILKLRGDY